METREIFGIRLSLIVIGTILAGMTSGVLASEVSASRETASQLSDLQARTTSLLRKFEEVARADSFARFSSGVIDLSKSVAAFAKLSFPRVEPLEDDVTVAMVNATSSFLDAAMCWADYEDPGRPGQDSGSVERRPSDLPSEQVIEGKRKALEYRVAEATLAASLYSKVAEQRANLGKEAEEGAGDEGLARAQVMGEVRRIAGVRLAATECVQRPGPMG